MLTIGKVHMQTKMLIKYLYKNIKTFDRIRLNNRCLMYGSLFNRLIYPNFTCRKATRSRTRRYDWGYRKRGWSLSFSRRYRREWSSGQWRQAASIRRTRGSQSDSNGRRWTNKVLLRPLRASPRVVEWSNLWARTTRVDVGQSIDAPI